LLRWSNLLDSRGCVMNSSTFGSTRSRAIDVGVALILAVLVSWGNLLWVEHNRFGLALTIDEAGYMSQAIAYANALKYGGIQAWLAALSYPTKFAPLSPIVSSILMDRLGVDENVAFYTHILFYAATVLVTFWWVRERSSRLAAISASLLVATLPDIVLYTRTYQYGLPTAFFFLLANFAYYKAGRFSSWFWSFWVGAALALMLLSRTMSIAFLPAFGLVWLLDSRRVLGRNMARLGMSVAVFLLIAVPWYASNFKEIFGYLFSFGYGTNSAAYDVGATSILSVSYLLSRIQGFMDSLYLFHFIFVFLLFWACVLQQAKAYARRHDSVDTSLSVPASTVVLCIAILFSSRNFDRDKESRFKTRYIFRDIFRGFVDRISPIDCHCMQ
jgi:4-amino-4-deoxy-L-arabinose transferase-like glycosyltransferase